jgi:hypothetical protein
MLEGRSKLRAVRCEDHLQYSAPKIGPVYPLSCGSEDELLNQISDMIGIHGFGRSPPAIELERIIYIHHIPFTRI